MQAAAWAKANLLLRGGRNNVFKQWTLARRPFAMESESPSIFRRLFAMDSESQSNSRNFTTIGSRSMPTFLMESLQNSLH